VRNGVLFLDANNDGKIGEKRKHVFTERDPAATSDLEALRAAFDSNEDAKLTAEDVAFARFKVLVTYGDGSHTARTLSQLDITGIILKGDATHIMLPDGSVITGNPPLPGPVHGATRRHQTAALPGQRLG
jgi:hypothetical protein